MSPDTDTIRILHIDDDPDFAELAAVFLERTNARFDIETATTVEDGLELLEDSDIDCIVSDYDLPGRNGIEFLEIIRTGDPDLPFILYTGKGSEEVASEAISAGVTDYLQKERGTDQYAVLANRITNAVEHYRSRQVVERSEQRLREVIDALPHLLYVVDENGTYRVANEALAAFHGTTVDAIEGSNVSDILPKSQAATFQGHLDEVLATGETMHIQQMDIEAANGDHHIFEPRLLPYSLADTGERAVLGIAVDVTERRAYHRELEQARDLLVRTEEIAEVGGWAIDPETMDMFWTEHLFDLLGIEATEEPSIDGALEYYHEEDRPMVERAIEAALDTGAGFDLTARFHRPDGETRWLRMKGNPTVEASEVVALRGAVQDITQRMERERELEQARTEQEELINGMNDSAWVIGMDSQFLAVNDAAVETTGYDREELLSMRPHDIDVGLDEEELTKLVESMPESGVQVFETVHETKDGEHIPVEISSSLVTYRGETTILSIARDISNRKQRERRLEEFASIVSHDLRNPLNVAAGHLDLVRKTCDSDHLDDVARAHKRMSRLIDDLLTLAREGNDADDIEAVDLEPLVEACWETVLTNDATLNLDVDRTLRADRCRLRQLLENLLRNAIEHGGDNITVVIGELDNGFYLEDDGSGIAAADREAVFENGHSTNADGTGFGLSIVKQVADAHDWTVRATESAAGGARFEITGVEWVNE